MKNQHTIRPYESDDKIAVLKLIKLNTPLYFDPSEETDLEDYLEKYREEYFVVEKDARILASGGINYFLTEQQARLSWDIVRPDCHGKGIGSALTQYRIAHIKQHKNIHQLVVRTTQLVFPFYQKMGFNLEKTEKDFWAEGLDLYQMIMNIN